MLLTTTYSYLKVSALNVEASYPDYDFSWFFSVRLENARLVP